MKLQFENRVYDILKWLCLEVATTINAVVAFVGALIGISTASYNKANGAGHLCQHGRGGNRADG